MTTLLTLTAGLLGGCASYPPSESPPPEEAQSPAVTAAMPPAYAATPAPTLVSAPVRPPALSVQPLPAQGYSDKGVYASYLTTKEYQEALEYQAALERYLTDPFIVANYLATERLLRDSQVDVASYGQIAVMPFTDVDRPEQTSPLGQMIGRQIASRLTQMGYQVAETFSPAPGLGRMAAPYYARATVVGHYVISQDRIFVNVRLIDTAAGSQVVSAYDYALPLDRTTLALVTGCFKQGRWICRLP